MALTLTKDERTVWGNKRVAICRGTTTVNPEPLSASRFGMTQIDAVYPNAAGVEYDPVAQTLVGVAGTYSFTVVGS